VLCVFLLRQRTLTGGGQHLFSREYRVRTGHETHRLFRFRKCIPAGSESNDRLGKHYAGSGNGTNKGLVLHRLNSGQVVIQMKMMHMSTPTSFDSKGVPGIGTNALTGKDSGCSGMLVDRVAID
jgi:hypothetical protein